MTNPFELILDKLNSLEEKISTLSQTPERIPAEIIDTKELCKRLDLTPKTVGKWRAKRKIPSFKVGESVRFNWPEVVEALQAKSTTK